MEHPDKLRVQETIPAKQREFIDALLSLLYDEFHLAWIPIAKTCYDHIRKVEERKKADLLGQTLKFRSRWMQDLRIKLLHDLARYVQANRSEFDGNAESWMQERLTEIWSAAFTEEVYFDWFAAACDGTTEDLESWRAPSWLPAALGFSNMKIRFEETDGSYGARLDLESTDKLSSGYFQRDDTTYKLQLWLSYEPNKMGRLKVLIYQGGKIPPGLLDNPEESLPSATQGPLISDIRSTKETKASGRRRRKRPVYHKREKKIREIIRRNPKIKGLIYCQRLDGENIKPPQIWQAQGCPPSYKEAYSQEGTPWRHYIHTEKSRLRPKSKKPQATKSNN